MLLSFDNHHAQHLTVRSNPSVQPISTITSTHRNVLISLVSLAPFTFILKMCLSTSGDPNFAALTTKKSDSYPSVHWCITLVEPPPQRRTQFQHRRQWTAPHEPGFTYLLDRTRRGVVRMWKLTRAGCHGRVLVARYEHPRISERLFLLAQRLSVCRSAELQPERKTQSPAHRNQAFSIKNIPRTQPERLIGEHDSVACNRCCQAWRMNEGWRDRRGLLTP